MYLESILKNAITKDSDVRRKSTDTIMETEIVNNDNTKTKMCDCSTYTEHDIPTLVIPDKQKQTTPHPQKRRSTWHIFDRTRRRKYSFNKELPSTNISKTPTLNKITSIQTPKLEKNQIDIGARNQGYLNSVSSEDSVDNGKNENRTLNNNDPDVSLDVSKETAK